MNLPEFFKSLWKEQSILMIAGLAHFFLFIILVAVSLFDTQQILGINRWIKPIKFAVSGGIFLWTVAV